MSQRTLFTVGHSTRAWAEFIALLKAWRIEQLADVRTVPRSRTFPWFSKERMEEALPKSAITYVHLPKLGGFRHSAKTKDSENAGWENVRFRAYADYMQTKEFEEGLAELNQRRKKQRVCVMCSEAVWWRCHRRMIADAEVARGIPVRHVMNDHVAKQHEMTEFAVVEKRTGRMPVVTYPMRSSPDRASLFHIKTGASLRKG
jgi:uncharacterized protein (DUF488 family)